RSLGEAEKSRGHARWRPTGRFPAHRGRRHRKSPRRCQSRELEVRGMIFKRAMRTAATTLTAAIFAALQVWGPPAKAGEIDLSTLDLKTVQISGRGPGRALSCLAGCLLPRRGRPASDQPRSIGRQPKKAWRLLRRASGYQPDYRRR